MVDEMDEGQVKLAIPFFACINFNEATMEEAEDEEEEDEKPAKGKAKGKKKDDDEGDEEEDEAEAEDEEGHVVARAEILQNHIARDFDAALGSARECTRTWWQSPLRRT